MARLDITLAGPEVNALRDSIAEAGATFEKLITVLSTLSSRGVDVVFHKKVEFKKGTGFHVGMKDEEKKQALQALEKCAEDFDRLQRLLLEIENFRFRIDVPPNCRSLDIHFDPRCMYENIPLPWDRKPDDESVPTVAQHALASLTEAQNVKLTQRCTELLNEALRDDEIERGYILTNDGGILFRARQLNRLAPVPHVLFGDTPGGAIHIHYHPNTSWFSVDDLKAFWGCNNERIEGVICKDGTTHFLEKTASYSKERFGEALSKFKNTTCILGQIDNCGVAYYRNGRLEET